MTVRADIQTALRDVVTILAESWQYRRRTSGPSAQTPTYGTWTAVDAHPTGGGDQVDYDDARQTEKRVERMRVRVSDALADLHIGDQFKDTGSVVWAVIGVASKSPNTGTVSYACERAVPLKVGAGDRQGGA
jgi:hypothetical protein